MKILRKPLIIRLSRKQQFPLTTNWWWLEKGKQHKPSKEKIALKEKLGALRRSLCSSAPKVMHPFQRCVLSLMLVFGMMISCWILCDLCGWNWEKNTKQRIVIQFVVRVKTTWPNGFLYELKNFEVIVSVTVFMWESDKVDDMSLLALSVSTIAISLYLLGFHAMEFLEIWLVEADFLKSGCRGERRGVNIWWWGWERNWDFWKDFWLAYRFFGFIICVPHWKASLRFLSSDTNGAKWFVLGLTFAENLPQVPTDRLRCLSLCISWNWNYDFNVKIIVIL